METTLTILIDWLQSEYSWIQAKLLCCWTVLVHQASNDSAKWEQNTNMELVYTLKYSLFTLWLIV